MSITINNKSFIKGFLLFSLLTFQPIMSFAQIPSWLWAKGAGGVTDDRWLSTATDAWGNVYVAGAFETPTIQFGSITLTNAGGPDVFLVKYNSSGAAIWARSAAGGANEFVNGIAIDPSGNIILAGAYFSGSISFGTITLNKTSYYDVFLAKYDTAGNVLWAKTSTGNSGARSEAVSVSVTKSGSIYMCGYYLSTVHFGTTVLNNAGDSEMFLVKYNANGTVAWARSIGGTGDEYGSSIATDNAGNVVVAGHYKSPSVSIGSTILNNLGSWDILLAKYDSSGTAVWAKSAGGNISDEVYAIKTDLSGNIFMTGSSNSNTYAFGSAALNTSGSYDAFVAKYDSSGVALWARSGAGSGADYGRSITIDSSGNAYVTGYFASPAIFFGTTILNNAGSNDVFVAKYNGGGTVQWAKSVGGASDDRGYSIAVDTSGIIDVGYFHSSPTAFGSFPLINTGTPNPDMYVAKLSNPNPVGINNPESKETLTVYPNPTGGVFSFNCSGTTVSKIEILDLMGRLILQDFLVQSDKGAIDLSGKPRGFYVVKLYTGNSVYSEKVELR